MLRLIGTDGPTELEEKIMDTTLDIIELSLAEISQVSGGSDGCNLIGCHTGSINFNTDQNGSFVQWPGKLGSTDGTYTLTSGGGLTWFPA
jgi:hypothetical protein